MGIRRLPDGENVRKTDDDRPSSSILRREKRGFKAPFFMFFKILQQYSVPFEHG
jgi:hypothetical protein